MKPIDPEKELQRILTFIQTTVRKTGLSGVVIGLSGGVDSAVSCSLAVRALGATHVFPILLPYGALGTQGVMDAMGLIEQEHIPFGNVVRIDIQPAVNEVSRADPAMDRIRKGNIMARMRMVYLFDQAKKRNALVLGTENRSEHMLGYFTRFGDAASDIEPIQHLYKTQVYDLAAHIGVPQAIMDKPPSANLWPEQTDEKEFGFTYTEADEILSLLLDEKKTENDIRHMGFSGDLITHIIQRMEQNAFKNSVPYMM